MRSELQKIENERKTFIATFKRYGTRTNWNGFPEKTILLINVKHESGKKATDHIWFKMTKGFENLDKLNEGEQVKFDARVKEYIKGWHGGKAEKFGEERHERDYKLNFPTKISKIQIMEQLSNIDGGKS